MRLPTFAELADPKLLPAASRSALAGVDPDQPHAANLARVHWFNDWDRGGQRDVPAHVEIPSQMSGVPARIVVAIGDLFPMIRAHKVLAAYACLAPRLAAGRFDPTRQRAVWPSTGNYCRGGVAISRILGCRAVAVLPAGMSQERFDWLGQWVSAPQDIVRTPGTESNVKEIYDACAELARDPANDIINQFSEFANYLVHWCCTGRALEQLFAALSAPAGQTKLAGFVAASGSAGTLAAGDYLKQRHGTKIAVVEAIECPTLLMNGYGEHNIQGIGDKHVPLIHNVTNTDLVIGVSDQATDGLNAVFNTEAGRAYLVQRLGLPPALVDRLGHFGLSSIANILGAIKMAKHLAAWARRGDRHGRHRRPRHVSQRADALSAAPPQRRRLERDDRRRADRPAPLRRRRRGGTGCHRARARAHFQPWLFHLGRAAGHCRRRFRSPPRARLLAGLAGAAAAVG